eukprot:COSAG02_NODE_460_length_21907_cov_7.742617_11_plen_1307_part_00
MKIGYTTTERSVPFLGASVGIVISVFATHKGDPYCCCCRTEAGKETKKPSGCPSKRCPARNTWWLLPTAATVLAPMCGFVVGSAVFQRRNADTRTPLDGQAQLYDRAFGCWMCLIITYFFMQFKRRTVGAFMLFISACSAVVAVMCTNGFLTSEGTCEGKASWIWLFAGCVGFPGFGFVLTQAWDDGNKDPQAFLRSLHCCCTRSREAGVEGSALADVALGVETTHGTAGYDNWPPTNGIGIDCDLRPVESATWQHTHRLSHDQQRDLPSDLASSVIGAGISVIGAVKRHDLKKVGGKNVRTSDVFDSVQRDSKVISPARFFVKAPLYKPREPSQFRTLRNAVKELSKTETEQKLFWEDLERIEERSKFASDRYICSDGTDHYVLEVRPLPSEWKNPIERSANKDAGEQIEPDKTDGYYSVANGEPSGTLRLSSRHNFLETLESIIARDATGSCFGELIWMKNRELWPGIAMSYIGILACKLRDLHLKEHVHNSLRPEVVTLDKVDVCSKCSQTVCPPTCHGGEKVAGCTLNIVGFDTAGESNDGLRKHAPWLLATRSGTLAPEVFLSLVAHLSSHIKGSVDLAANWFESLKDARGTGTFDGYKIMEERLEHADHKQLLHVQRFDGPQKTHVKRDIWSLGIIGLRLLFSPQSKGETIGVPDQGAGEAEVLLQHRVGDFAVVQKAVVKQLAKYFVDLQLCFPPGVRAVFAPSERRIQSENPPKSAIFQDLQSDEGGADRWEGLLYFLLPDQSAKPDGMAPEPEVEGMAPEPEVEGMAPKPFAEDLYAKEPDACEELGWKKREWWEEWCRIHRLEEERSARRRAEAAMGSHLTDTEKTKHVAQSVGPIYDLVWDHDVLTDEDTSRASPSDEDHTDICVVRTVGAWTLYRGAKYMTTAQINAATKLGFTQDFWIREHLALHRANLVAEESSLLKGACVHDYMRAWNVLRACLQVDPCHRPRFSETEDGFSDPTTSGDVANGSDPRPNRVPDEATWTKVMVESLKTQCADGSMAVLDAFPMTNTCAQRAPQMTSFTLDRNSGAISAHIVVNLDMRVPFGSFRSFRAALTSMRHKKQDPVIKLGDQRFQLYASSICVEDEDIDIFTRAFLTPFTRWVKWAIRVQEDLWKAEVFHVESPYKKLFWTFVPKTCLMCSRRYQLRRVDSQSIRQATLRVDLCVCLTVLTGLLWLIAVFDLVAVVASLGVVVGIAISTEGQLYADENNQAGGTLQSQSCHVGDENIPFVQDVESPREGSATNPLHSAQSAMGTVRSRPHRSEILQPWEQSSEGGGHESIALGAVRNGNSPIACTPL